MAVYKCLGKDRFDDDGNAYCDYEALRRWIGPCPRCKRRFDCHKIGAERFANKPLTSAADTTTRKVAVEYHKTGIKSFDHVLGGGLVRGATVLFGGPKGAGKTTLLLPVADAVAREGRPVLYAAASREISEDKVLEYCHRLGIKNEYLKILGDANDVEDVVECAEKLKPFLIICDSLQTMQSAYAGGAFGSALQGVEVTGRLKAYCEKAKTCLFIVNHLSKDGTFAGSEMVSHMVDTVLVLTYWLVKSEESEAANVPRRMRDNESLRLLYVDKNRNGEIRKVYVEMTATGVKSVDAKSSLELVP